MSILTTKQDATLKVPAHLVEKLGISIIKLRYDDECGNGHNTFSITALGRDMGGCCHEEIVQAFPGLEPFIKWHLCSNDGPLHYFDNTLFFAGDQDPFGKPKERELDLARSSAIWPEATDEELSASNLREKLEQRLPRLLEDFRAAMEKLEFTF